MTWAGSKVDLEVWINFIAADFTQVILPVWQIVSSLGEEKIEITHKYGASWTAQVTDGKLEILGREAQLSQTKN